MQFIHSEGISEVRDARLFDALLLDVTDVLTTMLGVYVRVAHAHVTSEMADHLGMLCTISLQWEFCLWDYFLHYALCDRYAICSSCIYISMYTSYIICMYVCMDACMYTCTYIDLYE